MSFRYILPLLILLGACQQGGGSGDSVPDNSLRANAKSILTLINTEIPVTLSGNAPGGITAYTIVTTPTKGTLMGTAPNLTYVPNMDMTGSDLFTYTVTGDGDPSAEATVSIEIEPLVNTLQGRTDGNGVDLVITGDGFTLQQQGAFKTAVDNYLQFHFGYNSVLDAQKNGWNVHRFIAVSDSSVLDGNTAYGAMFNCLGIQRLICVNTATVINAVAAAVPQYDYVVVLVNSTEYGGSGGLISVASLHTAANDVVLHELGHSFSALADEYVDVAAQSVYPFPSSEPAEPNVTLDNNPGSVKWSSWISDPNVDLFEGGRYYANNIWRPTNNSFMNVLAQPFYPVNQEAWSLAQYSVTDTHYTSTPGSGAVSHAVGAELTFSLEPAIGVSSQKVDWYVNDVLFMADSFSINCCLAQVANYNLRAEISDTSGAIRSDPGNLSSSTINWSVTVN